jgi:pSer/pThr/pTyr-binding forkhead associated (FHA) protein
MSGSRLLKIRLSLKGRPIRSYTFNSDVVTVGRTPEADIFLDNPGISREHLKLEMTSRGFYAAEDLGSANGTFLNDQRITREYLMNNDVLRIGKFSLWVSYEEDRRNMSESDQMKMGAPQGTMVLSSDELEKMMETSKEMERNPESVPERMERAVVATQGATSPTRAFLGAMIVLAFLAGTMIGAGWPQNLIP